VRHASTPTKFGLLFVCTGNVCRSPFAELLTAHLLAQRLGAAVRPFWLASAGIEAVVGSAIHPDTRRQLEPWGLAGTDADRFTARQLEMGMIEQADVILTASVQQRSAVLRLCPPALAKTFTVLEFARLIGTVDPGALPVDPVQRAHALVRLAPAQRGVQRVATPEDDSVADPMGKRRRAHKAAAQQISGAVTAIASAIAP
jgi:protein-tyrosine phosphatase